MLHDASVCCSFQTLFWRGIGRDSFADVPEQTSQASDAGSIPIARTINPVDADGFTGFHPQFDPVWSKNSLEQMPPQDGDFLFRRLVLPVLLHAFSPYPTGRTPSPFPTEPETVVAAARYITLTSRTSVSD
jgi:hypothetical protein